MKGLGPWRLTVLQPVDVRLCGGHAELNDSRFLPRKPESQDFVRTSYHATRSSIGVWACSGVRCIVDF